MNLLNFFETFRSKEIVIITYQTHPTPITTEKRFFADGGDLTDFLPFAAIVKSRHWLEIFTRMCGPCVLWIWHENDKLVAGN